ncbi:MAG: FxDxF family PEP-CTERM protein [Betaproteobacteria bacterium]|nr:FxDxF family PEP-CTERM protein [Betaproteobacteria bacterium]
MLQFKKSVAAIVLGLGCVTFAHAAAQDIGELSINNLELVGAGIVGHPSNPTFSDVFTFTVSDALLGIKNPLLTSLVWGNTLVGNQGNGTPTLKLDTLTVSLFAGYDVDTGTATALFTQNVTVGQLATGQFELFFKKSIPLTETAYTLALFGTTAGTSGGLYNFNLIGSMGVVPEPAEYAMLLAGLGVVGIVARRRKMAVN